MNDLSNNTFTINTNVNNSRRQINCSCGIPAVLREVKKEETPNRGKHFWACSKFGGPLHSERCNFFKWSEPIYEYHNDELSFTTQNRPEVPFVLVESYNNNNNNNDDNDEINLHPDQLSERPIVTTPSNRSTSSTGTPSTRSQSASPSTTTSTDTITTADSNNSNDRDLFDEVYKREPLVFDNWDVVPEYSIPQLLDIIQYHLLKQDKNLQKWRNATRSVKNDLNKAKMEIEKLKKDTEIMNKENDLYKRENNVLIVEKRYLERENNELKEENQELKRRRY